MNDLKKLIGDHQVRMWTCIVPEHRDRDEVTVRWDEDGVAHCTADGCEVTSAHTTRLVRIAQEQKVAELGDHLDAIERLVGQIEDKFVVLRTLAEGLGTMDDQLARRISQTLKDVMEVRM